MKNSIKLLLCAIILSSPAYSRFFFEREAVKSVTTTVHGEDFEMVDIEKEQVGSSIDLAAQWSNQAYVQTTAESSNSLVISAPTEVVDFSATLLPGQELYAGKIAYIIEQNVAKIVIAYQGTNGTEDVITDSKFFKTSGSELGIDGYLHQGFLTRYLQSRDKMKETVKLFMQQAQQNGLTPQILVTGHSLGGSLANIAAFDLKQSYALENLELISFCSPRVFDTKAAAQVDAVLGEKSTRVWRKLDIVSAVCMGSMDFKHTGSSLALPANSFVNILNNHSIESMAKDSLSDKNIKPVPHKGWKSWLGSFVSSGFGWKMPFTGNKATVTTSVDNRSNSIPLGVNFSIVTGSNLQEHTKNSAREDK